MARTTVRPEAESVKGDVFHPMTRQILFTSQKGGVGKSTLARAAAISLATLGRGVLLADFDTDQQTCMRWSAQRRARGLEPSIDVISLSKVKKLKSAVRNYDDVVIDTRGQHDSQSLDLAFAADVIFMPSSYSNDDLIPTLRVIESLRNAGVAESRVAIVFCRTGGSARQAEQARSILDMNQITALDAALPQKDGFVSLYATGRTGAEASNKYLRQHALMVDKALLAFIEQATAIDLADDATSDVA